MKRLAAMPSVVRSEGAEAGDIPAYVGATKSLGIDAVPFVSGKQLER